jgi:hypothetical protein
LSKGVATKSAKTPNERTTVNYTTHPRKPTAEERYALEEYLFDLDPYFPADDLPKQIREFVKRCAIAVFDRYPQDGNLSPEKVMFVGSPNDPNFYCLCRWNEKGTLEKISQDAEVLETNF